MTDPQFSIQWLDSGREPRCAPNPDYPNGIHVNGARPGRDSCRADLPYPARRCGTYIVSCIVCGCSVGITTAGRPDDPRSLTIECAEKKALA